MTTAPTVSGYQLHEQLLEHPLAEIWRGRSVTGMEVVALVLSDSGAADPDVRQRLDQATRTAAFDSEQAETPLWAANLTATKPYAITQLVPGQTGAERLLDPLDGVFGNDQPGIEEVRRKLQSYGAAPIPPTTTAYGPPPGTPVYGAQAAAGKSVGDRLGWRVWGIAAVVAMVVFTIAYSIGDAVRDTSPKAAPSAPIPVPDLVSPSALPSRVLLPGLPKYVNVRYRTGVPPVSVVGPVFGPNEPTQTVDLMDLPFAFRWIDRGDFTRVKLAETSYAVNRRVIAGENPRDTPLDLWITLHPCPSLAACQAERPKFDPTWTKRLAAPAPATQKDPQTWYGEQKAPAYKLSMTRIGGSGKSWWLVGVVIEATPGSEANAQRILNDIRTQTS